MWKENTLKLLNHVYGKKKMRNSKFRLVIDADVARAAGGKKAKHPTPKKCRRFLQELLKSPHMLVMTPAIRDEWKKHESNYSRTWRKSMVARKKIYPVRPIPNIEFEERIVSELNSESKKRAVRKDIHLVEAALVCDERVVSMDETVRLLLGSCAEKISEISDIVWVNPIKDKEEPIHWLKHGVVADDFRKLGNLE